MALIVTLKSAHGKYIGVQADGRVTCNATVVGEWEQFRAEQITDDKWALKSWLGTYLTAELDGSIRADAENVYAWEEWRVQNGETDGTVALINSHGNAITVTKDGLVVCRTPDVHAWECFESEPQDWWRATPAPGPSVHPNPLVGRLRIGNNAFVDDTGYVTPTFAHAGDLFSWFTRNKDFALGQMDDMVSVGYQGARVWFQLGCGRDNLCPTNHFWSGRECGPNWTTAYWDEVGQFLVEMHKRQLKVAWSQGDPAQTGGTMDARRAYSAQAANVARQVDSGYVVSFYDSGNEAWQNDGDRYYPDPVSNMASMVKAFTLAGGTALTTTTSPPSESPDDMDLYTPSGVSLWDVHSSRGGHAHDKRRHIFTLPYEQGGPKCSKVGIGSEPPGNGELVSASEYKDELDHEAMALLAACSLMCRTCHVWFSGEGVKLQWETPEGLKAMQGWASVPAIQRLLPKDIMTYGRLHHSGDTWRGVRVFSLTDVNARMDGTIGPDGRFGYIADGPSGHHTYIVEKPFDGQIITPGPEPVVDPFSAKVGERVDIEWKRGRVILGQVTG